MRCYNGCPDDELQAWIDSRQSAKDEARKLGMHIVWFPIEEKWMAFDLEPHRERSGFHDHPRQALNEAIERRAQDGELAQAV